MAKMTGKKKPTKQATAKARKKVTAKTTARVKWDDKATIKVVGEHNRRADSRYGEGYESMKKARTMGAFRAMREKVCTALKRPNDATELVRAGIKDGYIKVAG